MGTAFLSNFSFNRWLSNPTLPFWGAGFAALAATRLSHGGSEIVLGRHLVLNHSERKTDSKLFALLYPQEKIDKIIASPYQFFLINGHLWDLICKVLAATTFYLTSNESSLASIVHLLPTRLKTTAVAQALLHAAQSPRINGHFLFAFHIIDLAPVGVKILNILLEMTSLHMGGKNVYVEACREKTRQLGQWLESIWYARLALIACGTKEGVFNVLGAAALQVLKALLGTTYYTLAGDKFLHLSVCVLMGVGASLKSALTRPLQLEQLMDLSKTIQTMRWENKQCWEKLLSNLMNPMTGLGLEAQHTAHLHSTLETKVEQFLNDSVYALLCEKWFDFLPFYEQDLRQIYWAHGISKPMYENHDKFRLECIRFTFMLLFANLIRLQTKLENKELTLAQCNRAQDILYLQALQSIDGYVDPQKVECFHIGGDPALSSFMNNAKRRGDVGEVQFFEPLRKILRLNPEREPIHLNTQLNRLVLSLTCSLEIDSAHIQAFSRMDGNSEWDISKERFLFRRNLIEQHPDLQQERATWSLDTIIAAVQ